MNRLRLLAIGSMLLIAPGMLAQQTAPTGEPAKGAAQGVVLPDVGDQLKVLTQKLDLSVEQQPKVKTILQELHDASLKLMQGESTATPVWSANLTLPDYGRVARKPHATQPLSLRDTANPYIANAEFTPLRAA